MRYLLTISIYILLTTISLEQGSAREYPPHSKRVESGVFGSGMNDTVERVTSCQVQVIGTEKQHTEFFPHFPSIQNLHVLPDRKANCYQACATVTYVRSSGIVYYDDEGYPMEGTETKKVKRDVFQICGRQSCDGSDVYTSCESNVQPYLELCIASGHCLGYGNQVLRPRNSSKRNPYYNNENQADPDFEN